MLMYARDRLLHKVYSGHLLTHQDLLHLCELLQLFCYYFMSINTNITSQRKHTVNNIDLF